MMTRRWGRAVRAAASIAMAVGLMVPLAPVAAAAPVAGAVAAPAAGESLAGKVLLRVDDPRLATVYSAPTRKAKVVDRLPWGHKYVGQLVNGTLWYKIGPGRYLEAGTVNPVSSDREQLGFHVTVTIIGNGPVNLSTGPGVSKPVGTLAPGTKVTGQLVAGKPWYKLAHGRYVAAANTRVVLWGTLEGSVNSGIISRYGGPYVADHAGNEVVGRIPYGKSVAGTFVGTEYARAFKVVTSPTVHVVYGAEDKTKPLYDWYRVVGGGYVAVQPLYVNTTDDLQIGDVGVSLIRPVVPLEKARALPYDPSGAINALRAKKGWAPLTFINDPELTKCALDGQKLAAGFEATPCRKVNGRVWSAQYMPTNCTLDEVTDTKQRAPETGFRHELLSIGKATTKTVAAAMTTYPSGAVRMDCFITIRFSE